VLPDISSFLNPQKEYYSKTEVRQMELVCLQLLDYNLSRYSAFTILTYFLDNGIPYGNPTEVEKLYNDSYEVLATFVNDLRSLDFTPFQIACAVLLYTAETISFNLTKAIKYLLLNVYNVEMVMLMNASIVLKRYILI
jgi:hypothetical protein